MTRYLVSLVCAAAVSAAALPARACDIALLLAVDVSNSIDVAEYRLQVDGMADALLDPEIGHAMEQGRIAVSVMQWSGVGAQEISIGWTRITSRADVLALSQQARTMPRAFINSDTAPGEAIDFALKQFAQVPDCKTKVIDVSGDGTENAGTGTAAARRRAELAGVTINGIAIESMGLSITGFYRRSVITRYGFVMTARGHRDYPRAIREKILREVTKVSS
ncbi:MAG: DUF1194 domain-containing protein [Rhodobacteraceae bacterium]|nr:DUF1194 domain-containing protein [Paracoccaceae bacterium]